PGLRRRRTRPLATGELRRGLDARILLLVLRRDAGLLDAHDPVQAHGDGDLAVLLAPTGGRVGTAAAADDQRQRADGGDRRHRLRTHRTGTAHGSPPSDGADTPE